MLCHFLTLRMSQNDHKPWFPHLSSEDEPKQKKKMHLILMQAFEISPNI